MSRINWWTQYLNYSYPPDGKKTYFNSLGFVLVDIFPKTSVDILNKHLVISLEYTRTVNKIDLQCSISTEQIRIINEKTEKMQSNYNQALFQLAFMAGYLSTRDSKVNKLAHVNSWLEGKENKSLALGVDYFTPMKQGFRQTWNFKSTNTSSTCCEVLHYVTDKHVQYKHLIETYKVKRNWKIY